MKRKMVSRTIQITEDEAKALADVAADYDAPESALLQRWVQLSLRDARVRRAVAAYDRDEVDLREGAQMAGTPIGVFVDELAERNVPLLNDPALFEAELADLRAAFGAGRETFIAADGDATPDSDAAPGDPSRRGRQRAS